MRLVATVIPSLLFLLVCQTPQDTIRKHYETAEAQRVAGNLAAAEVEYTAILGEGYERLGETYLALEDRGRAITVLETAATYQPNSATVFVDLAIAYYDAQQYPKALVPARQALTIDPDNPGAHQMLGKTFFMLGDVEKSIAELETAARLTPNDIDVAYTLGIAYLRNRQTGAAKQLYESMIRNFGDRPQLHIVIGRAYRQSGLLADAAAEFKKAIDLDPRFPRAHYYLGITYLLDEGQSKMAEALREFQIEVEANPDEFFANYYLGVVYIFQRKWELAVPCLQKASAIQPDNPDPYFQLGQAYQELNSHEKAIEVLRKAIALNPDLGHNKGQVATAHHRLAQSLLKTGQTAAGQQELQIAADLKAQDFKLEQKVQTGIRETSAANLSDQGKDPADLASGSRGISGSKELDESSKQRLSNSEAYYKKVIATAHFNIGLLRGERQEYWAAAAQFALAAKWDPQQEGVDYNLGLALYKSGSYKRATAPLEAEIKAHPANRQAILLLGMSWFMLENYARTSELLSAALAAQPADLNIYYALASSLVRQGKTDVADRVIEQVKTVGGDSAQLHLLLAEESYARGNFPSALAELAEVVKSNSQMPLVHRYAGLLYGRSNKHREAVSEFTRELALNPSDVQTKYYLAEVLLAGEDVERGFQLIREVLQAWPESAAARYVLGKALMQRGARAEAVENFESAVKLDPEKPEFHSQLGQAYISVGRQIEGKSQIEIANQLKNNNRDRTRRNDQ
jgi:tetratricopeptide (TPR) repeat protein